MNEIGFRKIERIDLQKILNWRNSSRVRDNMISQEIIDENSHHAWHKDLDYKNSFAFIYCSNQVDVGIVTLKRKSSVSFDAGFYCGNENYLNDPINIYALIGIINLGFTNNFGYCITCVKKSNKKVLRLDQLLGFIIDDEFNDEFHHLKLNQEDFLKALKTLKLNPPNINNEI